MMGSLNPITKGHITMFDEARKLLLNEGLGDFHRPEYLEFFASCIGLIKLNADEHVDQKMRLLGQQNLGYETRAHLVRLATVGKSWLALDETRDGFKVLELSWPRLNFTYICMNGADDVWNNRKYNYNFANAWATKMLIMGRPGYTQPVYEALKKRRVDFEGGVCILGPELPNISSSAARSGAIEQLDPTVAAYLESTHPQLLAQHWQSTQPSGGDSADPGPGHPDSATRIS